MKRDKKVKTKMVQQEPEPVDLSNKVNVVAQELKFAKLLAGNDEVMRSKILKRLKAWLTMRSQSSYAFTRNDFLRLWKGLYYCMWMSDKPLVQEELAEDLGSLIHCFPDIKVGLQFYCTFLETMCLEWFGIDQWRIDKFMMLVRRVSRQALFAVKNADYSDDSIKQFANALDQSIFQVVKCPKGLSMHFCDFFVEELSKVSAGDISEDRVYLFLEPFMLYMTKLNDGFLIAHVKKTVFYQLLFQSELGQEYEEKFDIWKQVNFPTKSIHDLKVNYRLPKPPKRNSTAGGNLSDGEEEESDEAERVMDPRAGSVNVTLSEIKFDALKIAQAMENMRYKAFATSKSRKQLADIANKFRQFSEDVFPLGVQTMPQDHDSDDSDIDFDLKAMELAEFEKKVALGEDSDDDSDMDLDLDNRKKGKLKRKSKVEVPKLKEKKQKLSKLNNSRFMSNKWEEEDFTKEDLKEPEIEETVVVAKPKKIKKSLDEPARKTATPKTKEQVEVNGTSSKKPKLLSKRRITLPEQQNETSSESGMEDGKPKKVKKMEESFSTNDEWSKPLKEGESEFFVNCQKNKVIDAKAAEVTPQKSFVRNPFAVATSSAVELLKKVEEKGKAWFNGSPPSVGKRVVIALNKNIAQHPHEYIKQLKDSPNVPFDSEKRPTKSVLKPNALPSPINPFYQKKIGLNLKFDDTL